MLIPIMCLLAFQTATSSHDSPAPILVVLGTAQDGGTPQAGSKMHPGWKDASKRRLVVSLGLLDKGQRWMFEATPDFPEQLQLLDELHAVEERPGLQGIFITHAHIGHYVGLMHLGHESMGSKSVPVYAMQKMATYLTENGPWSQLVRYKNIKLMDLKNGKPVAINERIQVTPFLVPHRQEFSEVVGYKIEGPNRSAIFIPDIDSWEKWDLEGTRIETLIQTVDLALLDATFYDGNELPGRDMSGFPHPFIRTTMERLKDLSPQDKAKVTFIHLNHTNPANWPDSDARKKISELGFKVANQLDKFEL